MADMICTSAMCADGRASVQQMRATFDSLVSDPNFNRSYYEPTVIAIEKSFQANYSIFSEWVPFNPACCAVKDIGAQADEVTRQMLQSIGSDTPNIPGPGSTKPPLDLNALLTLGALVLGVMLLGNLKGLTK